MQLVLFLLMVFGVLGDERPESSHPFITHSDTQQSPIHHSPSHPPTQTNCHIAETQLTLTCDKTDNLEILDSLLTECVANLAPRTDIEIDITMCSGQIINKIVGLLDPNQITQVSLSHSGEFTETLGLQNLRVLNVSYNNLTKITDNLFSDNLQLRISDLSYNNLISLPDNLFQYNLQLETLNLSHNTLTSVPDVIFHRNLQLITLDLSYNDIEYLPASLFSKLQSLRTLSLQNNYIKELRSELFTDTKLLDYLDISNNDVLNIQPNLFSNLKMLKFLNMSGNQINFIDPSLFSNTKLIQVLDFSRNSILSLESTVFENLNRLWKLDLGRNQIASLPNMIFRKCPRLIELHLNHNRLSILTQSPFQYKTSIEYLDLGFNNISISEVDGIGVCIHDHSIYSSYKKEHFRYIPPSFPLDHQGNLKHLYLNNNNIKCIPNSFSLLYLNLETLDLSENYIDRISYSAVTFQSSHVYLNLKNNDITTIDFNHMWDNGLLLEEKEVDILLSGNPLVCDCVLYRFARLAQGLTFRGINNKFKLTVSDISQVQCHKLGDPTDVKILSSLDTESLTCQLTSNHSCQYFWRPYDLTLIANCSYLNLYHIPTLDIAQYLNQTFNLTIDLRNNSISALPGIYNPTISKLTTLILANNKLSLLNLTGLPPTLNTLDLRGNNLTYLKSSTLEYLNRTSMTLLFGGNPWQCDCGLMNFVSFLHVPSRKVLDYGDLQCGNGDFVMELTEHDLCPFFLQPMVLVTIISILVCLIIFAVLGTVSFYKYQQGIKVWLYSHHLCLWAITEEELDADKKYDAFISYSHKDEEFVNKVLVPGLESGEPKYRICLHYRDWMPGEFIQNQIVQSVEASRRTLVVLSPNFIESVWGQLEFRAAHSQALNDGTNRIIVVIYGEIPPEKDLDEKLRLYVQMKTYVKWGDSKFWEKLRYMMPHPKQLHKQRNKEKQRNRKDTDRLELCKSYHSNSKIIC